MNESFPAFPILLRKNTSQHYHLSMNDAQLIGSRSCYLILVDILVYNLLMKSKTILSLILLFLVTVSSESTNHPKQHSQSPQIQTNQTDVLLTDPQVPSNNKPLSLKGPTLDIYQEGKDSIGSSSYSSTNSETSLKSNTKQTSQMSTTTVNKTSQKQVEQKEVIEKTISNTQTQEKNDTLKVKQQNKNIVNVNLEKENMSVQIKNAVEYVVKDEKLKTQAIEEKKQRQISPQIEQVQEKTVKDQKKKQNDQTNVHYEQQKTLYNPQEVESQERKEPKIQDKAIRQNITQEISVQLPVVEIKTIQNHEIQGAFGSKAEQKVIRDNKTNVVQNEIVISANDADTSAKETSQQIKIIPLNQQEDEEEEDTEEEQGQYQEGKSEQKKQKTKNVQIDAKTIKESKQQKPIQAIQESVQRQKTISKQQDVVKKPKSQEQNVKQEQNTAQQKIDIVIQQAKQEKKQVNPPKETNIPKNEQQNRFKQQSDSPQMIKNHEKQKQQGQQISIESTQKVEQNNKEQQLKTPEEENIPKEEKIMPSTQAKTIETNNKDRASQDKKEEAKIQKKEEPKQSKQKPKQEKQTQIIEKEEKKEIKQLSQTTKDKNSDPNPSFPIKEQKQPYLKQLLDEVKHDMSETAKIKVIKHLEEQIKLTQQKQNKKQQIQEPTKLEILRKEHLKQQQSEQIVQQTQVKSQKVMDTPTVTVIIVLTFIISIPIVREIKSKQNTIQKSARKETNRTASTAEESNQRFDLQFTDLDNQTGFDIEEPIDQQ